MKNLILGAFVSGLLAFSAYADQLDQLEALAGEYYILQFNGDHSPTGKLRIVAGEELGIQTEGLLFPNGQTPSSNVQPKSLLSPKAQTEVSKEAMTLTQNYEFGESKLTITYENYGDFLIIQGTDCNEGCAADKWVVGKVGSFGSRVKGQKFFQEIEGVYENQTVGGLNAKPSTAQLGAVPDADEGIGMFIAPYCDKEETFCDGGYMMVSYANLKVWKRKPAENHVIYDIFITGSEFGHAPVGYYRWEVTTDAAGGKRINFKNAQYMMPPHIGGTVCMEHVAFLAPQ